MDNQVLWELLVLQVHPVLVSQVLQAHLVPKDQLESLGLPDSEVELELLELPAQQGWEAQVYKERQVLQVVQVVWGPLGVQDLLGHRVVQGPLGLLVFQGQLELLA